MDLELKVDNLKFYLEDCNLRNLKPNNLGNVILICSYYDFTRSELKKFNDIEKYFNAVLNDVFITYLYHEKREYRLMISL